MRPLTEILFEFNETAERYENLTLKFVRDQSEILQKLSCIYKELADHRIIEREKWLSYRHNSTAKSNAGKEAEADLKCPELYQLRHIMTACKLLIDTVRSTISTYKTEV